MYQLRSSWTLKKASIRGYCESDTEMREIGKENMNVIGRHKEVTERVYF